MASVVLSEQKATCLAQCLGQADTLSSGFGGPWEACYPLPGTRSRHCGAAFSKSLQTSFAQFLSEGSHGFGRQHRSAFHSHHEHPSGGDKGGGDKGAEEEAADAAAATGEAGEAVENGGDAAADESADQEEGGGEEAATAGEAEASHIKPEVDDSGYASKVVREHDCSSADKVYVCRAGHGEKARPSKELLETVATDLCEKNRVSIYLKFLGSEEHGSHAEHDHPHKAAVEAANGVVAVGDNCEQVVKIAEHKGIRVVKVEKDSIADKEPEEVQKILTEKIEEAAGKHHGHHEKGHGEHHGHHKTTEEGETANTEEKAEGEEAAAKEEEVKEEEANNESTGEGESGATKEEEKP